MSIIIVDDEAAVRSCLHDLLQANGHDVISVGSCDEALRILKDRVCTVALVDYHMGPPDGLETLRRPRAAHPSCAGILMTGSLDASEIAKAAQCDEIARVLVKPFPGDELQRAIEEARAKDAATT